MIYSIFFSPSYSISANHHVLQLPYLDTKAIAIEQQMAIID